ncbi:hypothetical protein G6514_004827 [Epicoccum nigrum]|nr:hypothetical protein G6514_004827 [Epicoccum nigrum]
MTNVRIGGGLYEALMQLRDAAKSRILWVDAVCIDQENLPERGEQVKIMRKIYNSATHVLIWLGPEDDKTSAALYMITELKNHVASRGLSLEALRALKDEDPVTEILGMEDHVYSAECLAPLWNLYHRPWFRRIWVIQEATAGGSRSQVHIGSHVIPWDDLGMATLWLVAFLWSSPLADKDKGWAGTGNALTMWQARLQAHKTLPSVLDEARAFLATDARDKVYALWGYPAFQRLSEEFGFIPDYTMSLRETYKSVTVLTLRSSQTLEILHYVDHPVLADDESEWPSWIPRWDRLVLPWSFPLQDYALYSNKSYGKFSLTEDPQEGILELKGVSIGYVSDVAQHIDWNSSSDGTILHNPATLAEFWDDVLQNSRNQGPKDPFTGLAQALTAGLDSDYNSAANTSARHTADAIDFLLYSFDSIQPRPQPQTPSSLHNHLLSLQSKYPQGDRLRYQKDIVWICTKRRLFHTRGGLFGLGPLAMRPGDVIAILYGGYTPFVLRPRGARFLLVGECYVNDVMGEDALELCRREDWRGGVEERVFKLI